MMMVPDGFRITDSSLEHMREFLSGKDISWDSNDRLLLIYIMYINSHLMFDKNETDHESYYAMITLIKDVVLQDDEFINEQRATVKIMWVNAIVGGYIKLTNVDGSKNILDVINQKWNLN